MAILGLVDGLLDRGLENLVEEVLLSLPPGDLRASRQVGAEWNHRISSSSSSSSWSFTTSSSARCARSGTF